MNDFLRHIIEGIGKVIDVYPNTDYSYLASLLEEDTIDEVWRDVGNALQEALSEVADEQKAEKTKADIPFNT